MVVVPIDADLDQPRITGLESSTEEDCSNKAQTPLSKPLPLWRKLAFAAGGLPMQMMQNIIAFFLPIFCLETVNLDPSYLSAILLVARVSDALTDPIMGFLVLKTRSRFGQKRPWILFSTPIFVGSFFALFYAVSWSDVAKLCLYITSIVMLQVGLTSFHVPYSSMTIVLTNIPTERDTLTAFRMFSEVLAILLGVSVFGAIIAQHRVATTCEESVYLNATSPEQVIVSPEAKQLEAWSYVTAASVTCAIGAAAALICFFGTREVNNSEEPSTKEEDVGFFKSVRLVLTYRPYLLHMGAFLFLSLGIQASHWFSGPG
ncbi:unnamed protein product [Mesocestoides corti]|uniref:MFS_1_like domain-containing protein n=1 Tax=Mesocestoides corti TaxID=53468 RepID=A0A0R3UR66_MESCO|nr:unnamed protein product [Mesocestoides corti]